MLAAGTGSTAPGAALASSASSLNVPAGPRNAARTRPAGGSAVRSIGARGLPRTGRAGQRQTHGLGLLGRELEFPAARQHALAVDARLVAVVDAGEDDPRPLVVEQGDRHRL